MPARRNLKGNRRDQTAAAAAADYLKSPNGENGTTMAHRKGQIRNCGKTATLLKDSKIAEPSASTSRDSRLSLNLEAEGRKSGSSRGKGSESSRQKSMKVTEAVGSKQTVGACSASDLPVNPNAKKVSAGTTSIRKRKSVEKCDSKQTAWAGSASDLPVNPNARKVSAGTTSVRKRKSDEKCDSPPKKHKRSEEKQEGPGSDDADANTNNGPHVVRSESKGSSKVSALHSRTENYQKVQQSQHKNNPRGKPGKGKVHDSNHDHLEHAEMKEVAKETDSGLLQTSRKPGTAAEMSQSKSSMASEEDACAVDFITDDSSSDSDFEEVHTQFSTPETSGASISLSDSSISRKLEASFSDLENTQEERKTVKPDKNRMRDHKSQQASGEKKAVSTTGKLMGDKRTSDDHPKEKRAPKRKPVKAEKSSSQKRSSETTETASKTKKKTAKKASTVPPKKARPHDPHKDDENDVMAILMKMEGEASGIQKSVSNTEGASSSGTGTVEKKRGRGKMAATSALLHSDTDGGSDWEEVEDYKHSPVKSQIPTDPVQITINDPTMLHKKRKKKKFDWKAYVQRKIKRLAKETQVELHKVHLLCLLSLGMQQNRVCSDATLMAVALSLVPPEHLKKSVARYDSQALLVVVRWFRSTFALAKTSDSDDWSLVGSKKLTAVLCERMAGEVRVFVMALVGLLRAMGFHVRLVMSLDPLPLKISQAATPKSVSKRKKEKSSEDEEDDVKTKTNKMAASKSSHNKPRSKSSSSKSSTKCNKSAKEQNSNKKRKPVTKKSKKPKTDSSSSSSSEDDEEPATSKKRRPTRTSIDKKRQASKVTPHSTRDRESKDLDSEPELSGFSDSGSNFSDEEDLQRKKRGKGSAKGKGKKTPSKKKESSEGEDSDEEFEDSFSVRTSLVKEESATKRNRKILSDDSSAENSPSSKTKSGRDYWLEVYLPSEQKWICVDSIRCTVGKPFDISSSASQPLLYVMAFDNYGCVKDITAKYAPQWLSHTRKQRVDSDWWRESLEPHASLNEELDQLENDNIKAHLMQRPLPTSIGEYKNHPLYALARHLLKYEAIYPEGSIPVGYIRQEPVYARDCVHTLHSRDNWLREARVVRVGETPYKMVKSRKRWNKVRDNPEELDLELFGRWQTEDYIPPPAVNGKVPKNEYGNVELFQPSMLPGGTVHIRVPALNRVAKKLGIDIAAAMTGWDHHCGFSHPVLDGWVVCEEHEDILMAAWAEDQEIQRQREEERREKRVLSNWTTLVRGLLIKDKLKKKFNLEEKKAAPAPKTKKGAPAKHGEVATDVQHAWPARQQQEQKKKQGKGKTLPQPSHYTVETM